MADRALDPAFEASPNDEALLLRCWNDAEAGMVRQLLDAYGIPTRAVSDVPHTMFPLSVDGLGEIRLLVAAKCLGEARSLLAEHLRQGLEVLEGGNPGTLE